MRLAFCQIKPNFIFFSSNKHVSTQHMTALSLLNLSSWISVYKVYNHAKECMLG